MNLSTSDVDLIKSFFIDKPVTKAYLFGAYSRMEADEDSDIDIIVELDYSKHIGLGFVKMKMQLEEKLHKKVDLISSKAISKYLLPFIEKDKRLIYEKQNC